MFLRNDTPRLPHSGDLADFRTSEESVRVTRFAIGNRGRLFVLFVRARPQKTVADLCRLGDRSQHCEEETLLLTVSEFFVCVCVSVCESEVRRDDVGNPVLGSLAGKVLPMRHRDTLLVRQCTTRAARTCCTVGTSAHSIF